MVFLSIELFLLCNQNLIVFPNFIWFFTFELFGKDLDSAYFIDVFIDQINNIHAFCLQFAVVDFDILKIIIIILLSIVDFD